MNTLGRLRVQIAGKTIEAPIYRDANTTRQLAAELTKRIEKIEEEHGRVDTQAFALEAALSLAAELKDAQDVSRAEEVETFNALDDLGKAIEKLVRKYRQD